MSAKTGTLRCRTRLGGRATGSRINPATISESQLAEYLHVPDLPDVDILLRTGAEQRTSNFLPWQTIYAELTFVATPWPEFNGDELRRAINSYIQRNRRYGARQQDTVP